MKRQRSPDPTVEDDVYTGVDGKLQQLDPRPKKANRRGRARETKEAAKIKWVNEDGPNRAIATRMVRKTTKILLQRWPVAFMKAKNDKERLRERIAELWPNLDAHRLPLLEVEKDSSVLFCVERHKVPAEYSSVPFAVFDDVFSSEKCQKLYALFLKFIALGPKANTTGEANNGSDDRSKISDDAYHLGVWSHYTCVPRQTADTRQEDQPNQEELVDAIREMFECLQKDFAPSINNILYFHARPQFELKQLCNDVLHQKMGNVFRDRPWLNMFGAFFTIACRAGSSEILHLDWNDDPRLWTLMFCVGGPEGWVGGDFCLPQLGLRIPMREGTLVACLTKRLVHCATAVTQGHRVVFTCFTDLFTICMLSKARPQDVERIFASYH